MKVSPLIDAFLLDYFARPKEKPVDPQEPKISVPETISWLTFAYEKIRSVIDYQQEHLLRKNAIARFLKRRIYTEGRKGDHARPLLIELIQSGYLPNHKIPERMIEEIEPVIIRSVALLHRVAPNLLVKSHRVAADWLLSVCAAELEFHLVEHAREAALANLTYRVMRQDFDGADEAVSSHDRDLQVYLAIHRSLLKSDVGILRFVILSSMLPGWFRNDPEAVRTLGEQFDAYRGTVEYHVSHPVAGKLSRFARRYAVVFVVFRDVLDAYGRNFRSLLDDPEDFHAQIRAAYRKRYFAVRARLSRAYVRTILYVFLTKMLLAFLLELPYDLWVAETTNYTPLFFNIIFHPFLMFVIAVSIGMPSKRNIDRIVELTDTLMREEPRPGFLLRRPKRLSRSASMTAFFRILYAVTYLVSFGVIVWVLWSFQFNVVSILLFLFFLAIVSFFGVRLRGEVRELLVVGQRMNWLNVVFDFFTVPLLHVGRWISEKAPRINVALFILDVIIEAPFKLFVELFEEWGVFQREKKEEIY